jgi:cytochrome c
MIIVCLVVALSPSWGQQPDDRAEGPDRRDPDLKQVDASRQVQSIEYCRGTYRITTAVGETHDLRERNLRLRTDSSDHGPKSAVPVLLPGAMNGMATLIFATPKEIGTSIRLQC